jgi:hypothetical protein
MDHVSLRILLLVRTLWTLVMAPLGIVRVLTRRIVTRNV